jgi:hypothetical protein
VCVYRAGGRRQRDAPGRKRHTIVDRNVVEEQLAWCIAVHAPRELLDRLRAALADGQLDIVSQSAKAMLPRATERPRETVTPVRDGDDNVLDNGLLRVRTNARGALLELASPRTQVPVSQANLISGLGRSPSEMMFELYRGEPFVRVGLQVNWRKWWGSLRLENWFAFAKPRMRYGIDRRFAALEDERAGCVIFAQPGTDWNVRMLPRGGVHVRAELLRTRGAAQLAWAFAPFEPGISAGVLEQAWELFAYPPRVRLFTSDDPAVIVVETKPANDGDEVLVRARECDGVARPVRLRCGARMREVDGDAKIEGERIVADIAGFGERIFRVRF